jgi:hypothetical protein
MSKIKAKEVNICIFSWKNMPLAQRTGDERKAWDSLAGVITELRKKHGQNVPIYMDFCPLTDPQNQIVISQNGINPSDLPAIQIWAEYQDGTTAQYIVKKDLKDKLGLTWTPEKMRPYVTALLYQTKPSEQSLLCQVFPIICEVPVWAWLGIASFATFEAITSDKPARQIPYAAGAGLAWNEFFKRGGFSSITKKS